MWTDTRTLYQIYPLGFCGCPQTNDGDKIVKRIDRIKDFIPHLVDLGVGGLYLSPLFESDRHGYDTRDYFTLDKRLGKNIDLTALVKACHRNGINVILDGVFNHVGRGFPYFKDVLEKRQDSAYKDWFFIDFGGNTPYNDGLHYQPWEGHYELVKLNLRNPDVKRYLFTAVKFWIDEFDIDGLRLDVAYSLDRDFLKGLRTVCEDKKKDFPLIGEVLFGDYNLIVNNETLHSCTNYENYKSLYSALNSKNLFELSYSLHRQFGGDYWCMYKGMHLMTFLENHDVSRIATNLTDKQNLPIAYALLFTEPGIPTIYYGGEWGIEGDKKCGDDALRPEITEPQTAPITDLIKKLVAARNTYAVFSYGGYKNLIERNESLVFTRKYGEEEVIVAVNIGAPITFNHGEFLGVYLDLITGKEEILSGSLTLPDHGFRILIKKRLNGNV